MKYTASTRPTVRKNRVCKLTLRLGLTGDALDQRATGQAVTDGGADGAAAEGDAATDEAAGGLDGLGGYVHCHFFSPTRCAFLWTRRECRNATPVDASRARLLRLGRPRRSTAPSAARR